MRCAELLRIRSLLVVGMVACAGGSGPVPVGPHLPPGVPPDVPQDRPTLAVGHFLDARPRSDRVARRPRLRVRWYGLERRGEHQTGDSSFAGSLAEGARADAMATLSRSGAFSRVDPVAVGDGDAAALAAEGGVDFVITGVLEELVGIRHQDFVVGMLLLGGFWSRFTDPIGLARIRYRVYDADGIVLDERIETSHRAEGTTPERVALDAVARTNEKLAERLFVRLVPERARVRRTVPIRIIDDCGLGRDRVRAVIEECSAIFEREAGIRLEPEWVRGSAPDLDSLEEALAHARRQAAPPGGALVWLVAPRVAQAGLRYGLSEPLGRHAVAACGEGGDARVVTVAHEVAHLFGAVHVRVRGSVMNPIAEFDARFFDPLNRRIVRLARERSFDGALPRPMRHRLDTVYRAALRTIPDLDAREIETLLAKLR